MLILLLIPIALILVAGIGIYNSLVALRNGYKNAFAQIDVQLKRRYDLIPNLVETVKGYMKHERETLEAVIEARNQAVAAGQLAAGNPGDAGALAGLLGAENVLSGALGRLFALAEAYPELKAGQNMMQLSEELATTENRISSARQTYNNAVMTYNTKRETFPSSVIAGMFNFAPPPCSRSKTRSGRKFRRSVSTKLRSAGLRYTIYFPFATPIGFVYHRARYGRNEKQKSCGDRGSPECGKIGAVQPTGGPACLDRA